MLGVVWLFCPPAAESGTTLEMKHFVFLFLQARQKECVRVGSFVGEATFRESMCPLQLPFHRYLLCGLSDGHILCTYTTHEHDTPIASSTTSQS